MADGHDKSHSIHMANRVQRVLGEALAFQLSEQTRKDRSMMLVGNEGILKYSLRSLLLCILGLSKINLIQL